MTGKTILVTGGMGYAGSRLVPHLLSKGHAVKVIDLCLYGDYGLEAMQKDSRWSEWEPRFTLYRGDIRHPDAVSQAMQNVDTVIHLAAISNDPTGEIDDILTRQVNYDAIGLLISIAKSSGVKRFINASSSSVFGIKNDANVTEELEPAPLTSYSKYKMLSEWIVRGASAKDFCTVNVRPATICGYSPRQRFDLTVNKLTADAIRKGVITVHGGQQRRPNVGMTDMINVYAQLVDIDAAIINCQTFNFGFENHKIIDIAGLIKKELADLPVEIKVTETFDNRDYHISSEKISRVIGYKPVSSIAKEVAELRRHLLESKEFSDIDAPEYYNMKVMKIERDNSAYQFLGKREVNAMAKGIGDEIDLLVDYPKANRNVKERGATKTESDRALARKFGKEFFDGDRSHGYGGFSYQPRFWTPVMPTFIRHFGLGPESSLLDVGCAKGFMLHDLATAVPGMGLAGVDVSAYAIENAIEDMRPNLRVADARRLPFADNSFDVVISINTIHNLDREECGKALQEIERVSRGKSFITVDAYRNEEEKELMYAWNLTAKTIMSVDEWKAFFREVGYTGDFYWFIP